MVNAALGAGGVQRSLSGPIFRRERRVGGPAPVADRGGFQDVAEGIRLERERVAGARIGRVPLVLRRHRLARVGQKDRVTIAGARLHACGS